MFPALLPILWGLLFHTLSLAHTTDSSLALPLQHFPPDCEELLIDDSRLQVVEKFQGNRWRGTKVTPATPGHFIYAELQDEPLHDPSNSLEHKIFKAKDILGIKTSNFFGYDYYINEVLKKLSYQFPSREHINSRIDAFNDLIGNDPKHPAYFQIKHFRAKYVDPRYRGRYFLEKLYFEHLWAYDDSGHFFFHDSNSHFINLIPNEVLDMALAQIGYTLAFLDWIDLRHPKLAKIQFPNDLAVEILNGDHAGSLSITDLLPAMYLTNFDFTNANFYITGDTNKPQYYLLQLLDPFIDEKNPFIKMMQKISSLDFSFSPSPRLRITLYLKKILLHHPQHAGDIQDLLVALQQFDTISGFNTDALIKAAEPLENKDTRAALIRKRIDAINDVVNKASQKNP